MRAIKSYFCFAPFFYRVLILTIAPLIISALNGLLMLDYVMPLYLFLAVMVVLEVFADYWTFGGICGKGIRGSEYMKSSVKGRKVLRQALITDCIRKLLWMILIATVSCVFCYVKTKKPFGTREMWAIAGMVLSAYIAILAGNVIGRYMQHYAFHMLIAYLASALYVGLTIVALQVHILMVTLGLAAGIGLTWLTVWNVVRIMEESYYDETA